MKKIYVEIKGGYGNQLFCYAFGYAVAKETNSLLYIDTSMQDTNKVKDRRMELLNHPVSFDKRISYKYIWNPKFRKFGLHNIIRRLSTGLFTKYYPDSNEYHFDKDVFSIKRNTYFQGFWQSYKYFDKYRNDIVEMYSKDFNYTESMKQLVNEMQTTQSVSVHIRRGDYVGADWAISMSYYDEALAFIRKKLEGKIDLFVFTDDKEFSQNYFKNVNLDNVNVIFPDYDSDNHVMGDLHLMSKCKHNIVANSSFSWWSAYLNTNQDKIVVCPEYSVWTGDFYPEDWNKIKAFKG